MNVKTYLKNFFFNLLRISLFFLFFCLSAFLGKQPALYNSFTGKVPSVKDLTPVIPKICVYISHSE